VKGDFLIKSLITKRNFFLGERIFVEFEIVRIGNFVSKAFPTLPQASVETFFDSFFLFC